MTFSHLSSRTDLENFRLVQRDFAELGAEFLFGVLHFWPTPLGLNHLLSVSRKGPLACHVKKVVLHIGDFGYTIWIPLKKRLKLGAEFEDWNSRAFENLLQEFEAFQRSAKFTKDLSSAFKRFPRLVAIQIEETPARSYMDPKTTGEMMQYQLSDELLSLTLQRTAFLSRIGAYRAFDALISAAHSADVNLLSFKSRARTLFQDSPQEKSGLALRHERTQAVFRNCLTLDLEFHPDDVTEHLHILSSAVWLKKLCLNFSKDNLAIFNSNGTAVFQKLQDDCVWAGLQELTLQNVIISSPGILFRFLECHGGGLRRLVLQNCELSEHGWGYVIGVVKERYVPRLERLELHELRDHIFCERVLPHWHLIRVCSGGTYSEEEHRTMAECSMLGKS